jgi:hypothetical protein
LDAIKKALRAGGLFCFKDLSKQAEAPYAGKFFGWKIWLDSSCNAIGNIRHGKGHRLATGEYTSNMNDLDVSIPTNIYFSAPAFHTTPLLHIETMRKNTANGGLRITRYSATKMTYCTAAASAEENKKFCAELTKSAGALCPEANYTCYQIR